MSFNMKPYQEELVAELQAARKEQEQSFEAARATLRENSEKQLESEYFGNSIPVGYLNGSLSPRDLAVINEQIKLRLLAKKEFLKAVGDAPLEHGSTVIVVGGNQLGKGLITARLIETLKKECHQVIFVDSSDTSKLYGKEADRMVIDSLSELGNTRFNQKLLKQMSPELETIQPYKKRKKGRNKSSFPGSGHY